jgi:nucleotide-binding universal stress UspA family protein
MFEKIVVGYAGDRAGRDAAVFAAQLAEALGSQLIVAFPYHPLFATVSATVAEECVRDELRALGAETGAIAEAQLHWSNASWPTRALHELAEFTACELIVLGAAPERLERRQVGLMGRIVHGAPCAVAVAPVGYADRPRHGLHTIGVGFADSEEGRGAVALGDTLARSAGAELRVIAGSSLVPSLASYAFASPSLPLVEDELYGETKEAAERVVGEILSQEGVRLDVRRGDPCRVLVQASHNLDLLILGSRGYGPLRHTLLGSVSAPVMREADCPVLVLPRGAGRSYVFSHDGFARLHGRRASDEELA